MGSTRSLNRYNWRTSNEPPSHLPDLLCQPVWTFAQHGLYVSNPYSFPASIKGLSRGKPLSDNERGETLSSSRGGAGLRFGPLRPTAL